MLLAQRIKFHEVPNEKRAVVGLCLVDGSGSGLPNAENATPVAGQNAPSTAAGAKTIREDWYGLLGTTNHIPRR